MARRPVEVADQLATLIGRGVPASEVARQAEKLGLPCPSLRTLKRRIRDAKGPKRLTGPRGGRRALAVAVAQEVAPASPRKAAANAPTVQAELEPPPEDADVVTLDRWIAEHEKLATKAKDNGDLPGYAAVHRLLQKALENRRKFRPPPAPDDGATPDMVRAGVEASRKLHELVDKALGVETREAP